MKNNIFFQSTKIAGIYLIFGVIWILVSDRAVTFFVSEGSYITLIQTFKGWAFIIATAFLLFLLLFKQFEIIDKNNKSIEERNKELSKRNIELNKTLEQLAEKEIILNHTIDEKNVLLKETHHRVKNNLQIISSLLSLQMNKIIQEDLKNVFIDSQQRIKRLPSYMRICIKQIIFHQ